MRYKALTALTAAMAIFTSVALLRAAAGAHDPSFGTLGRVVSRFGEPSTAFPYANAVAIQPDGKIVVVGQAEILDSRHPEDPDDDRFVRVAAMARYNPDGSLDAAFGSGGVVLTPARSFEWADPARWEASAVALQADGKILVAGAGGLSANRSFLRDSGVVVGRYHADGRLDRSFARYAQLTYADVDVYPGYLDDNSLHPLRAGMVVIGNTAADVVGLVQQPQDGKILIALDGGNFAGFNVARLNADGTPDLPLGPKMNIGNFFSPHDRTGGLALQADGKIVMAGSSSLGNFTLARAHPNGSADTSFGGPFGRIFTQVGDGLDYGARAVMISPADGKIVAAGSTLVGAFPGFALARYNTFGTFDSSFGIGGKVTTNFGDWAEARAAALQADGKIVVAGWGYDSNCERFLVARYNADGSVDASFGTNGRVFTGFGDLAGPGCNGFANALAIQPADGNIVVVGSVTAGGTVSPTTASYFALARYTGAGTPGSNTPPGTNVPVQTGPAQLTFDNVTQAGDTTVITSTTGPAPPSGFSLGDPPTYYDINTTATFTGLVEVCLNYTGITFGNEANLKLMHFEPPNWVDRTASLNTTTNVICAAVNSLSPFAVFEAIDTTPPTITASVTPEPNAAGWHNANPTVVWSVMDGESGVASSSGCETVTLTAETRTATLTCSAANGAGLTAAASVTVKIDKTPPLVACSATPDRLWPANHALIEVATRVALEDQLSGPADYFLRSVVSSEANNGTGDGNTAADADGWEIGASDTAGRLRAERSGGGSGRRYSLEYEGRDRADNIASCTAFVLVPHDGSRR